MRLITGGLLSLLLAGCGGARAVKLPAPPPVADSSAEASARPPADTLSTFMAKVRKLSEEARPARAVAPTVEGTNPRLAAAVAAAALSPLPEHLRVAAHEYARMGITDRAHEYLMKWIALAPRDAAAHDALARLWRDSGLPHLGLGDAYRAIHYAPHSPITHNTLGTILHAIGNHKAARLHYERALQLDPSASYALTNVCYGHILAGAGRQAATACQRALDLDPRLAGARNNLALAQAMTGDLEGARLTFSAALAPADAYYNIGIVHLARRDYARATEAFEQARAARPSMQLATARLQQLAQVATNGGEE